MSVIFNSVKDLPGKISTPLMASLEIDIKFGLWADQSYWLDPMEQEKFWYGTEVIEDHPITIEVRLGDETISQHVFKSFETLIIRHQFKDEEPGPLDLKIKISNFDDLPIRDNTGIFVSGMIEIATIKLQGIEISHLFENTMFGVDTEMSLPISRPIYQWMVENTRSILPKAFDYYIDEKKSQKNPFIQAQN